jgi:hypothetical protein
MIEPEITPYQPGDAEEMIQFESLFYQKMIRQLPSRPAYTARFNGKVFVCGGVKRFWPGVGEAWAHISPDICLYKRQLLTGLRKYIDHIMTTEEFWRIQAVVRSDFPAALRLARHLGFTLEAKMEGYGIDKVDCYLYSKVKK